MATRKPEFEVPTGDFSDLDDRVFGSLTLLDILQELKAENTLGGSVTRFEGLSSENEIFEFDTSDGRSYCIAISEEDAQAYAKSIVLEDLRDEPETFDQGWLSAVREMPIYGGESFNEFAADQALSEDGWQTFVSHYDGNSYTTRKLGLVYWRSN